MVKSAFTEEYRRFVSELVLCRKNSGLTQVELANALGQPQSFVSRYEHCQRRLDVAEFMAIAKVFGISPGQFLDNLS